MQSHDAVGVSHISDVPHCVYILRRTSVLHPLPLLVVSQSLGEAFLTDHGYSGVICPRSHLL